MSARGTMRMVMSALVALAIVSSASSARAQTPARPSVAAPADRPSGVVNLNNASEDQLELLPGIGPQKARAIVEHRRTHPFHHPDELMKVKGIGRKTFGRLRPYLTIVGNSTLATEVKLRR